MLKWIKLFGFMWKKFNSPIRHFVCMPKRISSTPATTDIKFKRIQGVKLGLAK